MPFSKLIDDYAAGATLVRMAVAGLTPDQLNAHPIAGTWSIREVVCHIADFEPEQTMRIKRVIAEDRPTLGGADEKRFVERLQYSVRDIDEEIEVIDLMRRHTTRILRALPDEAFARIGVHAVAGPITLETLIQRITNHIPHHLKFVAEKRIALGVPS